jgi:hypothetical protein
MRNLYSSPLVFGGFILGLLLAAHTSPLQAQNLYRVELMVFAYPAGGASEQWDALPELAYPSAARFLIDPRDQRGAPPVTVDTNAAPGSSLASTAFMLLPATERELAAGAASMKGSGRYRVLFHQAWVQPLPGQSAALPIVLDHSGEGGAWPELQGTITLYQAGEYILETNLWLNTRGEYLPGAWRMPPPPRGPRPGAAPAAHMQQDAGLAEGAAGESGQSPTAAATDYPYRHAVLLQQTRRMRGGEVYYIDHPLLGVVVKITSLEAPASAPVGIDDIPPASSPAL